MHAHKNSEVEGRVLKEYPSPTSPQDNFWDIFIYVLPDYKYFKV